mmetsp:Transcript_36869/g.96582  ORF Transcript_36869/g.96582 Transcript_36869/m.96582 type:complete len:239 (-) Transcript_36869:1437-2153(-)
MAPVSLSLSSSSSSVSAFRKMSWVGCAMYSKKRSISPSYSWTGVLARGSGDGVGAGDGDGGSTMTFGFCGTGLVEVGRTALALSCLGGARVDARLLSTLRRLRCDAREAPRGPADAVASSFDRRPGSRAGPAPRLAAGSFCGPLESRLESLRGEGFGGGAAALRVLRCGGAARWPPLAPMKRLRSDMRSRSSSCSTSSTALLVSSSMSEFTMRQIARSSGVFLTLALRKAVVSRLCAT